MESRITDLFLYQSLLSLVSTIVTLNLFHQSQDSNSWCVVDFLESNESFDGHDVAIGCIQATLRPMKFVFCAACPEISTNQKPLDWQAMLSFTWSQSSMYTFYGNVMPITRFVRL